jgi:imidazolonepropionase
MQTGSVALTNIGQLVTNDPARGGLLGLISEAAIVIESGKVAWVGAEHDMPEVPDVIDCRGNAVLPGFVDPHTHAVFAGDRAGEFARRLSGETYEEIMAAGGGIQATVSATRNSSLQELTHSAMERVRRMQAAGTTTVEIKSGYGLEVEHEKRILAVAAAAGAAVALDVVPTFLGAHAIPGEFAGDSDGYVDYVIEEMLPECAPLARFCDVFCDEGVFTVAQARRVLVAGKDHGLEPRLHANQLAASGGVELAAEVGARSADHLDHLSDDDIDSMKEAGTVAVLLPGVSFSLQLPQARGCDLWDAGVTVALGTDCNPGTSNIETMPYVAALACLEMGLTPEQAVWSSTRGGALALGLEDRGMLAPGAQGDAVILAHRSYVHLIYRPDARHVAGVVKRGMRQWPGSPHG